jgi:hypothetical protein
MSSNFELNKEAKARAAQIAVKTEELKRWLEVNHPDIHPGIGTQKAFLEDMGDSFLTASSEDFEYSLRTMTTIISRHRVQSEEEVKEELIDSIIERLQSTNNKHWQVPHNVQIERTKLQFKSLEELTARLNEVVRAQTINAMPAVERNQILVNARQYQNQYPAYPKTVVRPGTVRAIPRDRAYLLSLDLWDLKKERRIYGDANIDARLNGKD